MRPLSKPRPTQWAQSSVTVAYTALLQALFETIGDHCSFCEKPLKNSASLFHKVQGDVKSSKLSVSEWESLLLLCSDCKRYEQTLQSNVSYLWPDDSRYLSFSLNTTSRPFTYVKMATTVRQVDEQQKVIAENSNQDCIFVVANTGLDMATRQRTQAIIDLFQLNSPFYKLEGNQPVLVIPLQSLAGPVPDLRQTSTRNVLAAVDARLVGRLAAYEGVQEALQYLNAILKINTYPNMTSFVGSAIDNALPQIAVRIYWSGYWSTWLTFLQQGIKDHALLTRIFWGQNASSTSGKTPTATSQIVPIAGTRAVSPTNPAASAG